MKKLMMAVAFLGVLTLGACVDDNESQSVTDVRTAKAEALRAQAALDKANAEAALIVANAEAAVQAAQAAYKQAETEALQLENEKKKLALEKAKATLAVDIEAAIATAEAQLQSAKLQLLNAMINIDSAKNGQVANLITEANNVLTKLSKARTDKLDATTEIAMIKAGLVDVEKSNAKAIKAEQDKIAMQEALIAEYTKLKDNSHAEAQQAAVEAKAALDALDKVKTDKQNLYTAAGEDEKAKVNSCQNTLFYQEVIRGEYAGYYTEENIFDKEESFNFHEVELTFADGTKATNSCRVNVYNYVIDEDVVASVTEYADNNIKVAEANIKKYTAALADAKSVKTKADEAWKKMQDSEAYKKAKKTYDDAEAAEAAAADKGTAAWDKAKADLAAAKIALDAVVGTTEQDAKDAADAVEAEEEKLAAAKEDKIDAEKVLTDIEAAKNFLKGEEAKAYAELVEAYKKAWEAYHVTAYVAYKDADKAWNTQNDVYNTLNAVLAGTTDFETAIADCEIAISQSQKAIADLEDKVPSEENAIKYQEELLAQAEAEIKAYEALYNNYMAQIEALIAAEE